LKFFKKKVVLRFKCFLVAFVVLSVASCSGPSRPKTVPMPTKFVRIRIASSGQAYFDDCALSLEALKKELFKLKQQNGAVWFDDESFDESAREQSKTVRNAIIDAGIPFRVR
jgi:biopolymer transport protein ExbD